MKIVIRTATDFTDHLNESLIACIMIDFIHELYLLALRCIEREDKQCHGSYVTERKKMSLRRTGTAHLLLSGQMS